MILVPQSQKKKRVWRYADGKGGFENWRERRDGRGRNATGKNDTAGTSTHKQEIRIMPQTRIQSLQTPARPLPGCSEGDKCNSFVEVWLCMSKAWYYISSAG